MSFHMPEPLRASAPGFPPGDAGNGLFVLSDELLAIASDGGGWEHVSVSLRYRCPTWDEMCAVKALFWDAEDCVVQYHPPESEFVNNHPYCLHLWRPTDAALPRPPAIMVGIKALGELK